ncbi:Pycsar system effector family protein [uncultured Chitinophaga sp.]|uniref:Pycsar system effector family protein n=1 Tax=uncultured Chitinophaga sp. TaxID=339340 RepID=UPI0025ED3CD3|nr:Pycsar system effector family protein [uncultured Chitinophaga sp.]
METGSLIEAAEAYVTQQFEQNTNPTLVYHNLGHTRQVVKATSQISAFYRLRDDDLTIVMVAAWFHDMGYVLGVRKGHEEKGAEAARAFLQQQQASDHIIDGVSTCILATRLPQAPDSLLEQIVCDADLFHLGSKDYKETDKRLRSEVELVSGEKIPSEKWTLGSVTFLESHHYHTSYCQTLLKSQKEENLERLRTKLEKKQREALLAANKATKETPVNVAEEAVDTTDTMVHPIKLKEKKDKDKEDKARKPDRGIETMFRTTSTNHIHLSQMADTKANIMISVNSIIISIMVSVMFRRLEDYPNYILPSMIFLATSVATIIFSVLATRPNVSSGKFTDKDIRDKKANLLFFGNFHQMQYDDYERGMETIMTNSEYLYGNMIQDIFHLGVVLGRKYKLLRISYNIFMFGLVVSVLAFVIAALFFPVAR